jgi:palmitoyltransferase ZDHHC6
MRPCKRVRCAPPPHTTLVGLLPRFHAYLVTTNYTTIEFLEKRGCNPPPDHINRYDIGLFRNLESVLGPNPLLWLFPVRWFNEGDGLAFELNPAWSSMTKSK